MSIPLMLLAVPVLLLLQGFFSGSEMAIVSSDKARLRHKARQGDGGSKLALRLLDRPEMILSTTLIGTNISLVLLTSLVSAATIAALGDQGDFYAVLMLVPFTLILGEIVPKSVYQQRADDLTPKVVYALYAFSVLFYPFVLVFSGIARFAARRTGHGASGAGLFAVREQLRTVLDTAEGAATIDIFDRERIRNVVRFGELAAGDVMIPATEMTAIDVRVSTDEVMDLVRHTGSAHFPVYEGKRSQVIGIISASVWDVVQPEFSSRSVRELMQPAYFVPSQQPLVELLPVLRDREDQCAVVVDEYGSAIGMLTVDEILETVVGRIGVGSAFEKDPSVTRPSYEIIEEDVYLMDARLPIPEFNDVLGTQIGMSEARTIGGLITARLRHVPAVDEFVIEGGFRFTVVEATDRAARKLRVERLSRA